MKKSIVVLLHIGFWGCYLVLAMVILGVTYGRAESVSEAEIANAFTIILFFAIVPAVITFYSFYFLIFPKYIVQKKYLRSAIYGGLIALFAGLLGYGILNAIFGPDCGIEGEEEESIIGIVLFMAFVALVSGIIALVIRGFLTWLEEIKLKETLKQKNQEMELALVKAQLDPHFLFNTINNIDVLILKDAEIASNYLNKLSDIMRFMLYETKTDEILLSKEIEYIEKYIELQKIRTANQNYVHFSVQGKPEKRLIAPMIFIPFIENAFKHTNNKKVEDAIDIQIHINNGTVTLDCKNKFSINGKPKTGSNGLGNELIRKRLNLLYPDQHDLVVSNQDNQYNIKLAIKNG